MSKKTLLSGVKPTGRPHIGNYFGAMKQVVDALMNQSPQRIVHSGKRDKSETPPQALGQKIERKNEKLENVHKQVRRRKTVIQRVGYRDAGRPTGLCCPISLAGHLDNLQTGHGCASFTSR